jgi:hypothetical protein
MSSEIIQIIACNYFEGFQHLLNFIFSQMFNSIGLVGLDRHGLFHYLRLIRCPNKSFTSYILIHLVCLWQWLQTDSGHGQLFEKKSFFKKPNIVEITHLCIMHRVHTSIYIFQIQNQQYTLAFVSSLLDIHAPYISGFKLLFGSFWRTEHFTTHSASYVGNWLEPSGFQEWSHQ